MQLKQDTSTAWLSHIQLTQIYRQVSHDELAMWFRHLKKNNNYTFSSEASYSKVKSCFQADLAQPCRSDNVVNYGYNLK